MDVDKPVVSEKENKEEEEEEEIFGLGEEEYFLKFKN